MESESKEKDLVTTIEEHLQNYTKELELVNADLKNLEDSKQLALVKLEQLKGAIYAVDQLKRNATTTN